MMFCKPVIYDKNMNRLSRFPGLAFAELLSLEFPRLAFTSIFGGQFPELAFATISFLHVPVHKTINGVHHIVKYSFSPSSISIEVATPICSSSLCP